MSNFIFNWATAAIAATTLDLSTGTYYAHLVTTAPVVGHSTVADLVLPTTSGYVSTPLTGLSYNSARWTFDSFSFPNYAFTSAPTGVVICKRAGASPANSDGIICYSDFNNSIGQVITLQIGAYVVNLQFGNNGAINFTYRYQYNSGIYVVGAPIPNGLIYLIGTKNNTVTFANPLAAAASNADFGNSNEFTDRVVGSVAFFARRYAFNFGVNSIKPVTFGFIHRDAISKTIQLWGTNNLPAFDATNIDDDSLWTSIGSITNPIAGWNFITVANNTYWQYFKLKSSDGTLTLSLQEIELYSSTALSPSVNFV